MLRTAWIGILAFLADRISKQLVGEWLQLGMSKAVWPGVLNFTYTQNTGMAFSILADRTWMLIVFSVIALVLLTFALRRALRDTPWHNALLWLLLAGGLGNLVDRLCFGYVLDFFHVQFVQFPIFNVADICLSFAAVFIIMALLVNPDEKRAVKKVEDESAS